MLLQNSLREILSISEAMDSVVMDEIMYEALKWMRTGSDEEKKLLDRHWPKLLGLLHTDILALNSDVRKYESKEVHPTNEAMHELLAMLNTATLLEEYENKSAWPNTDKTAKRARAWFRKHAREVLRLCTKRTTYYFHDLDTLAKQTVDTWACDTKILQALTSSVTMTYYANKEGWLPKATYQRPLALCQQLFENNLYSENVPNDAVFLQYVYLSTHVLMTFTDFGMMRPRRPLAPIAQSANTFLRNSLARLLRMSMSDWSVTGGPMVQMYDALAETVEVLLAFDSGSVDQRIITFLSTISEHAFGVDRVDNDYNKLHGIITVTDALRQARTQGPLDA